MRSSVRLHHDWISCQTVNICAGWLVHVIPVFTLFTYPGEGESSLQEINNWKHWRNCQLSSSLMSKCQTCAVFALEMNPSKVWLRSKFHHVLPCKGLSCSIVPCPSMSFPGRPHMGWCTLARPRPFGNVKPSQPTANPKGSILRQNDRTIFLWYGLIAGGLWLNYGFMKVVCTQLANSKNPLLTTIWLRHLADRVSCSASLGVMASLEKQEVQDRFRLPMNTEIKVIVIMMKWR